MVVSGTRLDRAQHPTVDQGWVRWTCRQSTFRQQCQKKNSSWHDQKLSSHHQLEFPLSRTLFPFTGGILTTPSTQETPMPTKRRGRVPPSTASAAAHDDGAMDVDSPQGSDGPDGDLDDTAATSTEMWTDDQVASLFKGVVRWKPAGWSWPFSQWNSFI